MPKTTKAAQKAVNKYIANNYDRVNLTMPNICKKITISTLKNPDRR